MSIDPFADLSESLEDFTTAYLAVHRHHQAEPAPSSQAMADVDALGRVDTWAAEQHREGCTMLTLAAVGAIDNLRGLRRLIGTPETLYAPAVIGRAALEAAAGVWYLSDPSVSERERLRRGLNDTLIALHESRTLRAQFNQHEALRLIETHRDSILSGAEHMGFNVRQQRRSRCHYLDGARPSDTSLCTGILSATPELGAAAYRMLSAVAHARQHGLLSVVVPLDDENLEMNPDPPVLIGER